MATPNKKPWNLRFALTGCLAVSVLAAIPASNAQKTSLRPGQNGVRVYKPVRPDFWKNIQMLIDSKKPKEAFGFAKPSSGVGAEIEEWKVALARAMVAAGQPLHAQYWLSSLVTQSVATRQGFEALSVINEIGKATPFDEIQMEELAFDLDTKIDDAEPRAMIAYYKARALQRKGYSDWSQQALKDLGTGNAWSEELDYDRTLQILASGDAATAYGHFETLAKSTVARQPTAKLSRLAVARLIFERRDYKAAIEMFRDAELPIRERARSIQELAWSYYYEKSYGKALGAIKALKSSYFARLLSPETLLLEMLIYRELCHYQRIKALAVDFQKVFSDVYRSIEGRLPLETVPSIIQAALQEGVLQKRAQVIQQLRLERRELKKQRWMDEETRNELVKWGERRERITDLEVQRLLRARVDGIANSFLDMREQVWYLEYEANLRLIQQQETLVPDYEPPQKNKTQPDNFFWPVGKEAWLDELLHYEVLVKGTCTPNAKGSP